MSTNVTEAFKARELQRWDSWRLQLSKTANVQAGQNIEVHQAKLVRDGDCVGLESNGTYIPLSMIDAWEAIQRERPMQQ